MSVHKLLEFTMVSRRNIIVQQNCVLGYIADLSIKVRLQSDTRVIKGLIRS